jgi:hypothetical protein
MNIQAKTNEELRTKLSNLLQRKNSLWVQIEKLTAGLVVANENFLFKIKKKMQPINHHKNLLFKIKKKKIRQQISCCQYRTC